MAGGEQLGGINVKLTGDVSSYVKALDEALNRTKGVTDQIVSLLNSVKSASEGILGNVKITINQTVQGVQAVQQAASQSVKEVAAAVNKTVTEARKSTDEMAANSAQSAVAAAKNISSVGQASAKVSEAVAASLSQSAQAVSAQVSAVKAVQSAVATAASSTPVAVARQGDLLAKASAVAEHINKNFVTTTAELRSLLSGVSESKLSAGLVALADARKVQVYQDISPEQAKGMGAISYGEQHFSSLSKREGKPVLLQDIAEAFGLQEKIVGTIKNFEAAQQAAGNLASVTNAAASAAKALPVITAEELAAKRQAILAKHMEQEAARKAAQVASIAADAEAVARARASSSEKLIADAIASNLKARAASLEARVVSPEVRVPVVTPEIAPGGRLLRGLQGLRDRGGLGGEQPTSSKASLIALDRAAVVQANSIKTVRPSTSLLPIISEQKEHGLRYPTELLKTELALTKLAQTELVRTESVKTELAKTQLARMEVAKTELETTKLAKTELVKTQLARTELSKTELETTRLAKTELAKTQLAKTELSRTELAKTQLEATQLVRTELAKTELVRTQLAKTELGKTELAKTELAKTKLPRTELSRTELETTQLGKTELSKTRLDKTRLGKTTVQLEEVNPLKDIGREAYKTTLEGATADIEKFTGSWEGALNRLRTAFYNFHTFVIGPLRAIANNLIIPANKFEFEMAKITGLAGQSRTQVAAWSGDILAMAGRIGKPPMELAEAMYFITSSGISAADALGVLDVAARSSVAGLGSTKDVADLLTSAINAYKGSNLDAAQAADILTAAVREGKTEADAMAKVIGRILPTSSQLGVSFADVSATLAVMSRTGGNAAQSATAINGFLMSLLNHSPDAAAAADSIGLSFKDLRNVVRGPGGLLEAFRLLEKASGGNEETMTRIIPGYRGLRTVFSVISQDAETVDGVFKRVANSAGDMNKAFEERKDTDFQRYQQAINAFRADLVKLGDALSKTIQPTILAIAAAVHGLIDFFDGWNESVKKVVLVVFSLVMGIGVLVGTLALLRVALSTISIVASSATLSFLGLARAKALAAIPVPISQTLGFAPTAKFAPKGGGFSGARLAKTVVGTAASVFVLYEASQAVAALTSHFTRLNASLEKATALQSEFADATKKTTDISLEQASKIKDPEERKKFLEEELKSAEATLKGQQREVREGTKNLGDQGPFDWLMGTGSVNAKYIEDLTAKMGLTKGKVDILKKALEEVGREAAKPGEKYAQAVLDLEKKIKTAGETVGFEGFKKDIQELRLKGVGDEQLATATRLAKAYDRAKETFSLFKEINERRTVIGLTEEQIRLQKAGMEGVLGDNLRIAAQGMLFNKVFEANVALREQARIAISGGGELGKHILNLKMLGAGPAGISQFVDLQERQRRFEDLGSTIQSVRDSALDLDKAIVTFGKSGPEATIVWAKYLGVADDQLKGMQGRVDQLNAKKYLEDAMTPMEKYQREARKVKPLFDQGLFGKGEVGAAKFAKIMEKVRQETLGTVEALEKIQGSSFSSAEALTKYLEYQERLNPTRPAYLEPPPKVEEPFIGPRVFQQAQGAAAQFLNAPPHIVPVAGGPFLQFLQKATADINQALPPGLGRILGGVGGVLGPIVGGGIGKGIGDVLGAPDIFKAPPPTKEQQQLDLLEKIRALLELIAGKRAGPGLPPAGLGGAGG